MKFVIDDIDTLKQTLQIYGIEVSEEPLVIKQEIPITKENFTEEVYNFLKSKGFTKINIEQIECRWLVYNSTEYYILVCTCG